MKEGLIAGLISGVLSPIILSWLKYNIVWKNQRRHEIKYQAFESAVKAMSQYETDALDFELQSEKKNYQGTIKQLELRPETSSLIDKSRGMVLAFFSDEAFKKYDSVFKANISIENVPNIEFEDRRNIAIKSLMKELGLAHNKYIKALTSCCKGWRKKPRHP